ncbi:hypothetical protein ABH973_006721 [Bradyrhizobium ottawaense]|uniref:hypothetical protein n=1 Tax=Bradyrhizobium ottawaense TaxID=931866 RepID=UPI003513558E
MAEENPVDFLQISWEPIEAFDVPDQERCRFTNKHPSRTLIASGVVSADQNFQCKQLFGDAVRDLFPQQFEVRIPPQHGRLVGLKFFPHRRSFTQGPGFDEIIIEMKIASGVRFGVEEPVPDPTTDELRQALLTYSIPVHGVPNVSSFDMIINASHKYIIGVAYTQNGRHDHFSLFPTKQASLQRGKYRINELTAIDLGVSDSGPDEDQKLASHEKNLGTMRD